MRGGGSTNFCSGEREVEEKSSIYYKSARVGVGRVVWNVRLGKPFNRSWLNPLEVNFGVAGWNGPMYLPSEVLIQNSIISIFPPSARVLQRHKEYETFLVQAASSSCVP